MKRWLLCILIFVCSCQEENKPKETLTHQTTHELQKSDDFSEFQKEDDESCDTEEDLEKKLEAQIEKSKNEGQAMQLQGSSDPGCEI